MILADFSILMASKQLKGHHHAIKIEGSKIKFVATHKKILYKGSAKI
jgi:hypothetical protein